MAVTKEDVRAEHEAALARLDEEQLKALKRINQSFLASHFNNCSAKDSLEKVFEDEAQARSGGDPS